ncbi:UNVERIFIED_CONTAM: coenzyme PQQ synthesis protein D (PqqD) [Acetivibrio alkalicellulosi]
MKIKPGYMIREIAKNHVVVPVGDATVDFNGMITLNDTGAFLWKQLLEDNTVENLTSELINEYDIDEKTAKRDVFEFVEKLKDADLID